MEVLTHATCKDDSGIMAVKRVRRCDANGCDVK
jgi:hypothetical protein